MTVVQRQFLWLAYALLLLLATLGVMTSAWHVVGLSGFTVVCALIPWVLAYGWIRLCMVIWKPLYRQDVSPGWCLALLFGFFAVIFLSRVGYFFLRALVAG
jgi:hypothetical protein